MSTIIKLNSKTRIVAKSKDNLANYQSKLSDSMIGFKAKYAEKKPPKSSRNSEREYKKFLKEIFHDKKFVSEKFLNKKLRERFGASSWYRDRMIGLGMISSKNKLIKLLTQETQEHE